MKKKLKKNRKLKRKNKLLLMMKIGGLKTRVLVFLSFQMQIRELPKMKK